MLNGFAIPVAHCGPITAVPVTALTNAFLLSAKYASANHCQLPFTNIAEVFHQRAQPFGPPQTVTGKWGVWDLMRGRTRFVIHRGVGFRQIWRSRRAPSTVRRRHELFDALLRGAVHGTVLCRVSGAVAVYETGWDCRPRRRWCPRRLSPSAKLRSNACAEYHQRRPHITTAD